MSSRFSGRLGPIMAAGTGSKRLAVIHANCRPRRCYVATVAAVRRSNVICILARCLCPIVAADAGTDRTDMRECSRRPCGRPMAILAYI
jgi:hypothetical protein